MAIKTLVDTDSQQILVNKILSGGASGSTLNLYVSPSGSDTNDGLTSLTPKATLQAIGDLIYGFPWTNTIYKVNLAAGTYLQSAGFFNQWPSSNRVQWLGPTVARGVQPTAIIQAVAPGSGNIQGIYLQNNIRAQFSNINFKSFRTGSTPTSTLLSGGLIVDTFCDVYTDNVWTDDCDQGIYVTNGSFLRCQAGRHGFNLINGASIQFIRHAKGSVGYGGSAPDVTGATGTAFIGGQYGVILQEFSMSHTDNCYYNTQTIAGALLTSSRIHSVTSIYNACTIGVDGRLNSTLGLTDNTYPNCGTDHIARSGSVYATGGTEVNDSLVFGAPVRDINAVGGSTQSTSPVTIYTHDFLANELELRGNGFKLNIVGDVTGTANTKTIVVTLGATTLLTATIAASVLEYEIQVELKQVTAASSQKVFTRVEPSGASATKSYTTIAEDMSQAKTLTVTHQVTNAADLNRIGWIELEITH